jgi:hypothetical protein
VSGWSRWHGTVLDRGLSVGLSGCQFRQSAERMASWIWWEDTISLSPHIDSIFATWLFCILFYRTTMERLRKKQMDIHRLLSTWTCDYLFIYWLSVLGFELRALCLLDRCSTAWATSQHPCDYWSDDPGVMIQIFILWATQRVHAFTSSLDLPLSSCSSLVLSNFLWLLTTAHGSM